MGVLLPWILSIHDTLHSDQPLEIWKYSVFTIKQSTALVASSLSAGGRWNKPIFGVQFDRSITHSVYEFNTKCHYENSFHLLYLYLKNMENKENFALNSQYFLCICTVLSEIHSKSKWRFLRETQHSKSILVYIAIKLGALLPQCKPRGQILLPADLSLLYLFSLIG